MARVLGLESRTLGYESPEVRGVRATRLRERFWFYYVTVVWLGRSGWCPELITIDRLRCEVFEPHAYGIDSGIAMLLGYVWAFGLESRSFLAPPPWLARSRDLL